MTPAFSLTSERAPAPAIEQDYDDGGSYRQRGAVVKAVHLFPDDLLRRGQRLYEIERVAIEGTDGPVTVSGYPMSDGRRRIGALQELVMPRDEWVRRVV